MAERIGVYVCECGPNIKDAMDLNGIVKFAQGLEEVVLAKSFKILCSDEGKELIKQDIKKHKLTRVVIAACSPKEHEITFRKVLSSAGLNPFLMQITNIREQCAWVIKDNSLATDKAKIMIRAAAKRVIYHEHLEIKEIECQSDVLVVGAGIAGINAALTLAQKKRKVYLVEKLPSIGGKVALYDKVFSNLECASCMLDPKLDEVLHSEHIELLTFSEVKEVRGFYGNFIIEVKTKARFVDMKSCIGCGACFAVCPVKVKNEYNEELDNRKSIYIPYTGALPNVAVIDKEHCLHLQGKGCNICEKACPFGAINYNDTDQVQELKVGAIVIATGFDIFDLKRSPQYGYGEIENVYTSPEFERLLSSTGPTEGKILLKNGQPPKKVAFVHCVGSKTREYNEYCSGFCCMYSLKFSYLTKQNLPGASIVEFYSNFCLPGKESESFFNRVTEENGIEFIHMKTPDSITIAGENDSILISCTDVHGKPKRNTFDMVVLAPAIEGVKEAEDVAKVFDVSLGKGRFFIEDHAKLAPVSTATEGIFIVGCAQGPNDIQSSVAQGQAAAGIILSRLEPGEKVMLEAMTAIVDEDNCSGCKICIGVCPCKSIAYNNNEKHITVNEVLCSGCGFCASTCPSGAIKIRHFTDVQISAEIKELVK